MKVFKLIYLIVSLGLIIFLGNHYFKFHYNKKVVYVDKAKEDLIDYFNEICLGSEFGNSTRVTRKWHKPMNLFIVKDKVLPEQTSFIKETVDKINSLTSKNFKITITKDSLYANTYLFVCPKETLKAYPEPFKNIFRNISDDYYGFFNYSFKNNEIYKASIFINSSKSMEFQKSAIIEEIVQALGFGNDSEIYSNSIFYQSKYRVKTPILELTEFDKMLIKLLYHPKMKVGLDRIKTDKTLRKIIDEEGYEITY